MKRIRSIWEGVEGTRLPPVRAVAGASPASRACPTRSSGQRLPAAAGAVEPQRRRAQSGLATLELVLCLPILLTILALIINLGIEVKWKVRSLAVSRQVVWRQRPLRKGAGDPRPAGWPSQGATLGVSPAPAPPLFPQDPFAQNMVVRGPVLRDPNGSGQSQLRVDTDLFDISGKVEQGNAKIDRPFPLLPNLAGVHFNVEHLLADGQWRYLEMSIGANDSRRVPRIYRFDPPGHVTNLAQQYQQAAIAIINFPLRSSLAVLDRDDELIAWYGAARDFHPTLQTQGVCTLDRFDVYGGVLQMLIVQIQGRQGGGADPGVPSKMADAFIRMYEAQVAQLQNQIPPDLAQIDALKKLIEQLQSFKGTLY